MDLVTEITDSFKNKKLTKEEKIRSIYLQTAAKFSFDPRFGLAINGNKELLEFFQKDKIRVRSVNKTDITCITYCESILGPLIEHLVNVPVRYIGEGIGHRVIDVPFDGDMVTLDATECDLTRVKLKMSTTGFVPYETSNMDSFNERIKEIDKKLGYIKDDYADTLFKEKYTTDKVGKLLTNINKILIKNKFTNYSDAKYTLIEVFDLITNDYIDCYVPNGTLYNKNNIIGVYFFNGKYIKLYKCKDGYYKLQEMSLSEFYYTLDNSKFFDIDEVLDPDIKSLKKL